MTEVIGTKSQPNLSKLQKEKSVEITAAKKKNEEATNQENLHSVTAEIQAKRLELLLSVRTETKTTFTWQKGFMERAAAQGVDLGQLQYEGKPIIEMTQENAAALVAEDGYFGVAKTSQRLADFVITGGGDDLKRLQAGREGIIKGFKDAEKVWGGELPEISHKTLDKALELIDTRIRELGGGALVDVLA